MPSSFAAGPPEDAVQHAAVHALRILDTPRDPAFDRLVFIAAQLFRTPIAAVAVMDADRVWYKARVGVIGQAAARDVAFCSVTARQGSPLLIEDASMDQRFHDNPLVCGPPGLRFYAGVPLLAPDGICARLGVDSMAVGALCVMDRRRRVVAPGQMGHLEQLAREATALLAARELAEPPPAAGGERAVELN